MCRQHAAVRGVLENLPDDDTVTILDMGASPEPFSRGTVGTVQRLVLVTEPSYKSLEASRRLHDLGRQLGIPEIGIVANKVRTAELRGAIADFADRADIPMWAVIPFDDAFVEADVRGTSALDGEAGPSTGLDAVAELAQRLIDDKPMSAVAPTG